MQTYTIGSFTCRSRHLRCDEGKPICQNCLRKGYDCLQPEFVINTTGHPAVVTTKLESEQSAAEPPEPRWDPAESPSSIWDIFNQASSDFHKYPAREEAEAEAEAEAEPEPEPEPEPGAPQALDAETAELLRVFQEGVAAWLDLWDHSLTFSREAHRLAFTSPLLREAICALSARQLDLIDKRNVWASVAARRYGASLRYLIAACNTSNTDQTELFTATILLSCTELLSSPGPDHRKHLLGAATLVKSRKLDLTLPGLDRASFRVFVRQDLAVALANRSPTMISPSDWSSSLPENGMAEEDAFAHHIVWLCARAANLVFESHSPCAIQSSDTYDMLTEDIDAWLDRLPQASRGVTYTAPDRYGFQALWFPVPAAIVAMLTYHEAKILLLGEYLSQGRTPGTGFSPSVHTQIQYHATRIGSIASSKIPDGAHVYSVQPLFCCRLSILHLDDVSDWTTPC